jgi:glucosylceramidase
VPVALARGLLAAVILALTGAVLASPGLATARPAGFAAGTRARANHRTRSDVRARRHRPAIVVHIVQTASSLSQRMKRMPDMRMKPGRAQTPPILRVQGGLHYQRIRGFGAALTDSSAWLIRHELAPAARNELMRRLFSSHGIDLNYLRLPMGASDFTVDGKSYSYDDMPVGKSDPRLRHFSVAHDVQYIIPTLRQALAIHPGIFVMASPWSAPGWMKTNQRSDNFDNGGTLLPVDYGPLAAYFVRFLQAYRSHGIVVDAVTPQNEPVVAADPGMQLSEPDEATFITQDLRVALAAARLSTQIFGHDLSWDMLPWASALATGPAGRYLSGISWHCYFDSPTAMTQLHALAPRLIQLVNECSPEIRPFHTAETLIGSLRNGASAVALWNLALDPAGGPVQQLGNGCPHCRNRCPRCRGVVTVDETSHRAYPGPTYYQLGQVSRFVARGAVRIGVNTFVTDGTDGRSFYEPTAGLDDVAFVNPSGEKVLVTYNNSPNPIRFAVSWHEHRLTYSQQAGAMTTFTWR